MKKTNPPILRHICNFWSLYDYPTVRKPWSLERQVVAVKEAEHRPLMKAKFPEWCDRVEYWHVHDLDCATPEHALPHLEQHVVQLLERLAA